MHQELVYAHGFGALDHDFAEGVGPLAVLFCSFSLGIFHMHKYLDYFRHSIEQCFE